MKPPTQPTCSERDNRVQRTRTALYPSTCVKSCSHHSHNAATRRGETILTMTSGYRLLHLCFPLSLSRNAEYGHARERRKPKINFNKSERVYIPLRFVDPIKFFFFLSLILREKRINVIGIHSGMPRSRGWLFGMAVQLTRLASADENATLLSSPLPPPPHPV